MHPNVVSLSPRKVAICSTVNGITVPTTVHGPIDMSQKLTLVCHLRKLAPANLSGFIASEAPAIVELQ